MDSKTYTVEFEDRTDKECNVVYYPSPTGEFALFEFKKDKAVISSGFHSCREDLAEDIWTAYADKEKMPSQLCVIWRIAQRAIDSWEKSVAGLQKEIDEKTYKQSKAAQNVINLLEKAAGWPKTEIYRGRYTQWKGKDKDPCVYGATLFVTSNKWRFSPQLFSLFSLLVRCGTHKQFESIKSLTTLREIMPSIRSGSDYAYYRDIEKWLVLLKNVDKIFYKTSTANWNGKNYHHNDDDYYWLKEEGIHSFLHSGTRLKRQANTFYKLYNTTINKQAKRKRVKA